MEKIGEIPRKIREMLGEGPFSRDTIGLSGAQIFCGENRVLKIEALGEESRREYELLKWLDRKLPVPRVLGYAQQGGKQYLLMSRMEGEMLCAPRFLKDPEKMTRLLSQAFSTLWQVDVTGCPCPDTTEKKLRRAEKRVAAGLCTREEAEPETYGPGGFDSPERLLLWLQENRPEEEPVFSHGDFCLPNLLVGEGGISGYLDWGRGGVSDRYQDLSLCCRSLRYNRKEQGGPEFSPQRLFFALGLTPDWEKLRYYQLLDELL